MKSIAKLILWSYDIMKGSSLLTKPFTRNPLRLPPKDFSRLVLSMLSLGMSLNFARSRTSHFFSVKFILLFSTVTRKAETASLTECLICRNISSIKSRLTSMLHGFAACGFANSACGLILTTYRLWMIQWAKLGHKTSGL